MKNIIACIDSSGLRQSVCDGAIWAAKRLNKTALFLHTIEKEQQHGADDLSGAIGLGAKSNLLDEMTQLDAQRNKLALKLGKELLANACQQAEDQGVTQVVQKQHHGDFVESLLELEDQARLIVAGRSGEKHQPDFKALGSHIESLIRQVHTPVVIVPGEFKAPTNFMLAYDGRDTADQAVDRIISGGLLRGLTCHLVTIRNKAPQLEQKFRQTAERLEAEGFEVKTSLLEGDIFSSLMDYQSENGIELLVMGAFAHSKLRQLFLGSNTLRMIENSPVPLIVLK